MIVSFRYNNKKAERKHYDDITGKSICETESDTGYSW